MQSNVLVIGASGGIASALLKQLNEDEHVHSLVSVSRSDVAPLSDKHQHHVFDSSSEAKVEAFVKEQKGKQRFTHVICCTGVLHSSGKLMLKPEKRLEDINAEQLSEYFRVNTIVPAIWVKHAVNIINKDKATIIVFSARVGSISENRLGGWYGYRASKAALNMIMKTAAVEYKRRSPNTALVCYHPGTVDTELSKPFQANVKPSKLFTPDFTVEQLIKHTLSLDPEDSPFYLDWEGKTINW
uniref:SDR family NAD(P)-dependent oxidoreductase n=1 Tax=Ningiella ruwaisensis TaxID=2364274 RepID=UPI0010A0901D|nr:SDR family NAD(P)-dependent oxidoreductase [Ningiella ruwaisensis]